MHGHDTKKPDTRLQFQQAAKDACKPYTDAKAGLHTPSGLSASGNTTGNTNRGNTKSSTQVESVVSHKAVRQHSCGLKPDRRRDFRIVIRFRASERARIVKHAQDCRQTVSQYVRLVLLNDPGLDPQRHSLLMKINYQLTRQGTNLNQIAKQLNMEAITPDQAAQAVAALRQEFSEVYSSVGKALANGRKYEDED